MIYTELTKRAMLVSYTMHKEVCDKGGVPYIFHPYHLAEQMGDDEDAICVALLHDVVEDTEMTIEGLSVLGFPKTVVLAVEVMTHKEKEEYLGEYIQRIKQNPLARKVKIADLLHNSDETRIPEPNNDSDREWNQKRMEKYQKALEILQGE